MKQPKKYKNYETKCAYCDKYSVGRDNFDLPVCQWHITLNKMEEDGYDIH